ncbi:unnamed protein product [Hymenolepis diminuta]|uniref:Calcineurin-like phosphoesterase domain-containing protein n=1 Tax=Hymenolepis diminuta TaxID=6216 RepID=A0A564Y7N8_HYMDI|nr:unnamed protein product [Hymenolepis diminuta]
MFIKNATFFALFLVVVLVFWCEFVLFYFCLFQCTWPQISEENLDKFILPGEKTKPVRILLVSDTHIGVRHQLIDRIRRHWLLNRAFKTAMSLYSPEVVIHLGDLLDQGFFEPDEDFNKDVGIVRSIFNTDQKSTVFKVLPGNHDVGFHHRLHPYTSGRFNRVFRLPADQKYTKDDVEVGGSVKLWSYKGLLFVFLNSMAFEGDSCRFCRRAEDDLQLLTKRLQCLRGDLALQSCQEDFRSIMEHGSDKISMGDYTHPILIQHFPLFRPDETVCKGDYPDSMPESGRNVPYKSGIDCLSDSVTRQLFFSIRPRLAFSGHSHYFCHRTHTVSSRSEYSSAWKVEEWTLPALSYRVSGYPGFILLHASRNGYAVKRCRVPTEWAIGFNYVIGLCIIILVYWSMRRKRSSPSIFPTRPIAKES